MKAVVTRFAWCAALCLLAATPAVAEMSACQSAAGTSAKERIADLTTCIERGHNGASMNAFLYLLRGASYAETGDMYDAFKDYSTAIDMDPRENVAFALRGQLFANRGDWARAQADFDRAIAQAMPGDRSAFLAHKAWLFATWSDPAMRDGATAVTLAQKANKLRDTAYTRDVLAAAYAEAGQFDDAVREESAAIGRLPEREKDKVLPGYKERLALYQAHLPYHTRSPFPVAPHVDL